MLELTVRYAGWSETLGLYPVTHFTVIRNTKQGIREQLETYLKEGVDHPCCAGIFREAKPQQAEILTMPQIL